MPGRLIARTNAHELRLERRRSRSEVLKTPVGSGSAAREAEALTALAGEGVVSLRRMRGASLVLDFVPGPTLEQRILRRLLAPHELIALAGRLSRVMERIWSLGWVHADLKPANILLPRGSVKAATLIDFETARRLGDRCDARATIDYAAPELILGVQHASPALDVFALGAVLCACRMGQSPFWGATRDETTLRLLAHEPALLSALPPRLASAISKMVAKEPAARPASLGALVAPPAASAKALPAGRPALHFMASEEPYGSVVAAARRALGAVAGGITLGSLRRTLRLGASTRSGADALVVAELLGIPLDDRGARALAAAHADSQLLRRARQRALSALLTALADSKTSTIVAVGVDSASREVLQATESLRVSVLAHPVRAPAAPSADASRPASYAAAHPEELAASARRFAEAGEPLRACYYAWRAADRAFEVSALERTDTLLGLAERELETIRGRTPSLLAGLVHVSRARLQRWQNDIAGAADSARHALALLPSGSAAFCDALAERALTAGKLGRTQDLRAVAAALRDPPGPDAVVAWDRAAARAATQLYYSGERKAADGLTALFLARTTTDGGVPDARRRGLSPSALVTAALYHGRLDEYLARLVEATRAFDAVGDDRSACLYGSAVGFALCQLGAYGRAARHLRAVRDRAERMSLGVLVALTDHNLGEAVAHMAGRLHEAIVIESRAIEALDGSEDRRLYAGSLAYRARMLLRKGAIAEAKADADKAVAAGLAHASLAPLIFGTVTEVALAEGDVGAATSAAERAYHALSNEAPTEAGEALAELAFARAALARGQVERGAATARRARERIETRAASIANVRLRRSFLECIPEHRALARIAHGASADAG